MPLSDPTTTLITQSVKAVAGLGMQAISGAQANQAARDEQTFRLDSAKEQNRAQSVKDSLAFNQDLRNRRFSQQDKERQADMEKANPLTTQTKYLMFGGGAVLLVILVIMIIFLTR